MIYSNNAYVAKSETKNYLKIAVSVPISSDINGSKEILRGVAQAQDEINKNDGINGRRLWVEIGDDQNNSNIAKDIASYWSKDQDILGIIGSNSATASLTAAPIYQESNLVMISPGVFSNKIVTGNYIFTPLVSPKRLA